MSTSKDYLNIYAKGVTPKFQEGGAMPAAPAGTPATDPAQLEQMVQQYAQSHDPQLAVAIADTLVAMMGGQSGAPAEGSAPAPAMRNGGVMSNAPMFKKGGKLV